ncbi:MAG: helicase-related protein, partial [Burkholderiaceae bacterium]
MQFAQSKYKTKSNEYINPPNRYQVEELTSRLPSDEVVEKLDLLFKDPCSYPKDSLRFVLATNIIEVGIDVPRLSLMTILNQPKNTSQYIQVSGRVGRKSETPPLITTIFSPLRPRDRSHYENFKTFHEKLYLGVEPTSVTPFSDAAISNMLEGAFFMYFS